MTVRPMPFINDGDLVVHMFFFHLLFAQFMTFSCCWLRELGAERSCISSVIYVTCYLWSYVLLIFLAFPPNTLFSFAWYTKLATLQWARLIVWCSQIVYRHLTRLTCLTCLRLPSHISIYLAIASVSFDITYNMSLVPNWYDIAF